MSNFDYSSTVIIEGKKLIEDVKKACFQDGSKCYLDVAVLFGVRKECPKHYGEEPLNNYEINLLFDRIENPQRGFKETLKDKMNDQSGDIVTRPYSEDIERLYETTIRDEPNGAMRLYFDTWKSEEIWVAISTIYKDSVVTFIETTFDEIDLSTHSTIQMIEDGESRYVKEEQIEEKNMNKNEIKEYVENEIEYHMNEFDLEREDTLDVVLINIIDRFINDEIDEQWLLDCSEYLGRELDINLIKRIKESRKKSKERRKARKELKK